MNLFWTPNQVDGALIQAFGATTIGNVPIEQRVRLLSYRRFLQMKNMSNARCDVQTWFLYPREDIRFAEACPLGVQAAGGAIDQWCLNRNLPPSFNGTAPRAQDWNEHDAQLGDLSTINARYFVKKGKRYFLEPGGFQTMRFAQRRPRTVSKAMKAVTGISSYGASFQMLKGISGPLLLFRVQGCAVHDATKSVDPMVDKQDLGMTMGSYNVEFYSRIRFQFTIPPSREIISKYGMLGARLPGNLTVANEVTAEPQEAFVGPMEVT